MLVIGAIANDGGSGGQWWWKTGRGKEGWKGTWHRLVCCCLFVVVVVVVVCCLLLLVLFLDAEPNRAHNGECTASTVLIRGFNGG